MHIQAAIEGMKLSSEHVFREIFARDNFSWRLQQRFQQLELNVCQIDFLSVL